MTKEEAKAIDRLETIVEEIEMLDPANAEDQKKIARLFKVVAG